MRFLLFASILLYVCDVQAIPHDWNSTTLINVIKSITRYDNHTYRLDNVATIDDEDLAREWLKNLSDIYSPAMPVMTKISWLIETETPDDSDEWKVMEKVLRLRDARKFLEDFKTGAQSLVTKLITLKWSMLVKNLTAEVRKEIGNIQMMTSKFSQSKMQELSKFDWRNFEDKMLRRSFHRTMILMGDSGIQDVEKTYFLKSIKSDMIKKFSAAKINLNGTLIGLDPEINSLFEKNRDYDELALAWVKWRDASGKQYGHQYPKYIKLNNEATGEYGFKDYGEYIRSSYESDDLNNNFDEVYSKLEELYRLLHAYTKKKLVDIYPNRINVSQGALPAHVFGDLWAQQWHNIYEEIKPFKDKPLLDITPNMKAKNVTVNEMVKIAENFFKSLGMEPLPQEFWNHSIFVKPTDGREINCHASAWDFLNGKDFRIKMCSEVNMNDLFIMHHEMGHIYYYIHYKDQPFQFKEGANPGFHEAIGDLMTLSVMTPSHLHKIGLLEELVVDDEQDINFLLFSALRNVAFAPFALAVEKWRWDVYSGKTTEENYNADWWKLRCKYQGIVPPVGRNRDDFDPGSKYHIAASVPYDRYFVSLILTFQFHEALCKASNHKGPLHLCDIYESKAAGKKISEMMRKGISEPWPGVLSELTDGRQNQLDPSSMLEYFKPLTEWLKKQNLTDTDWDCDSYIDADRSLVKSYDGQWASAASSIHFKIDYFLYLLFIIFVGLKLM